MREWFAVSRMNCVSGIVLLLLLNPISIYPKMYGKRIRGRQLEERVNRKENKALYFGRQWHNGLEDYQIICEEEKWINSIWTGKNQKLISQLSNGNYVIATNNTDDEICLLDIREDGSTYELHTFTNAGIMGIDGADKTTDGYIISECFYGSRFDINLLKINDNFVEQWNNTVSINNFDIYGRSIKQTFDGGYIITGYIQDENVTEWFLLKTDENGNFNY